ncbi:Pre-mRNA-splicing factor cwf19 [Schizosaccharomyces pombe]
MEKEKLTNRTSTHKFNETDRETNHSRRHRHHHSRHRESKHGRHDRSERPSSREAGDRSRHERFSKEPLEVKKLPVENEYFDSKFASASSMPSSKDNPQNNDFTNSLQGLDFGTFGSRIQREPIDRKSNKPGEIFVGATLQNESSTSTEHKDIEQLETEINESGINYKIGDNGSRWRMMKLKRVFDMAQDQRRPVEEVALERYGSLKEFDFALEERDELELRKRTRKVQKEVPTGELYEKRCADEFKTRKDSDNGTTYYKVIPDPSVNKDTPTESDLNRLKADLLRAQLKKDPNYESLEREYQKACDDFENSLHPSENSNSQATIPSKKRNFDDPTIDEMVQEEKLLNKQRKYGQNYEYAKQIAKDKTYSNNLDYLDENAGKLSNRMKRGDVSLAQISSGGDLKKINHVLDTCPLCLNYETQPLAPVISLSHRAYVSLPTQPELAKYHCLIVPTGHRINTLSCDEDEWDEIRNFMKCIALMFDSMNLGVIFYENAPSPQRYMHTAIECIPVSKRILSLAPAYFREALSTSDEEWSQHRKIIDTLEGSKKYGKWAFRKMMVKELGYFHVWFSIDGGYGHVVEDEKAWGRHDQVPRQVFASMLNLPPEVIRRKGSWTGKKDPREDMFRSRFEKFDWTKGLID